MTPPGWVGAPARAYRRFCRGAALAFALVAAYTLAVKLPAGELAGDWLHTVLHVVTGAAAAYLGWGRAPARAARAFTVLLTAAYGLLAAVGAATGGIALDRAYAIPLRPADHAFHAALALAGLATVLVAQRRAAATARDAGAARDARRT